MAALITPLICIQITSLPYSVSAPSVSRIISRSFKTSNFGFLDDWKAAYGVTIENPQEALDEIIRIRNTPVESIDDLRQQVEYQAQALEELISLTLE